MFNEPLLVGVILCFVTNHLLTITGNVNINGESDIECVVLSFVVALPLGNYPPPLDNYLSRNYMSS